MMLKLANKKLAGDQRQSGHVLRGEQAGSKVTACIFGLSRFCHLRGWMCGSASSDQSQSETHMYCESGINRTLNEQLGEQL